jgi:hypothetical protein
MAERKRPFFLDKHTDPCIYTTNAELSEMGEGRVLLWHRLCTSTHIFLTLSSLIVSLSPQGSLTRGRGVVRVGHQAQRYNALQQVIVSKNDREEVWAATPTGNLLAECFFKAPDETPEEVEHMGYPQLIHLYPPEELLVGPGIAPEEVEEICVEV